MGSIDIPPFLREKQKQKVQAGSSGSIPPFLKKKEEIVSENVSEDLSTGTEDISIQQSKLSSEIDPSKYETILSPQDEQKFQSWLNNNYKQGKIEKGDYEFYKENGYGYGYDFRAAFEKGEIPKISKVDGRYHWSDVGKKPNHPTFSNESKYNNVDGHIGGSWDGEKFIPASIQQSDLVTESPFDFKRQIPRDVSMAANLRPLAEAKKNIHFGTITEKELSDLQQNEFTRKMTNEVIKQYVPEVTDETIDSPNTISLATRKIKEANRINAVNAEKEGISQLDNNISSIISEFNKPLPANKAGRMTDHIDELRAGVNIDDPNNNDKISDAIAKVKKIDSLEQSYFINAEEKMESREKNQSILTALNNRLQYNISKKGITPTINQLNDPIEQAVLSKVMESERGEPIMDAAKDQIKISQFKLGLTAVEKSDPILFNLVVNAISSEKKVSEEDFSNISRIGQQIDNSMRFRGGAYDPSLIDTETAFDYTTFGQKKSIAAAKIGEWAKNKGYKNIAEFPERIIRQGAKEVGEENKEIIDALVFDEKLLAYDAIPKSGWVDDIMSGAMQPLQGINSTLSSWNESPSETYLRSKSLEPEIGGQKVPNEKGEISDVLPSERGRFTTDMFRGLGQFIPQVLLAKGVGAGLRGTAGLTGATISGTQARNIADLGGTYITTFLQSFGPSYEEHLQKTGDANTAALIGTIDGIVSGGFETFILPDVRLAGKAFDGLKKGLATDLATLIKKGGDPAELAATARPFVQKFFKNATNILTQEVSEELGTQYVDFVTESIFDPASAKERNLNKELWDVFKSTAAAMMIPSILGAGGSSVKKDFTTKSLHSAAINFDSYKESLQKTLDNGYISQDGFNKSVQILSTHRESIGNAPEVNAIGETLSTEQKLNYAFEDTKIKVYKDKSSKTDGVAKEMWDGKIKEAQEAQREILIPEEKATEETKTELTNEKTTDQGQQESKTLSSDIFKEKLGYDKIIQKVDVMDIVTKERFKDPSEPDKLPSVRIVRSQLNQRYKSLQILVKCLT